MTYETNVAALGEKTSNLIEGLWVKHMTGVLSFDEFSVTATRLLVSAQAKGVAISELTLAGYFQQAGLAVPAFQGLQTVASTDGLQKAVATIAASDLDTVMQLRRLATAEVMEAAGNGYQKAMKGYKQIKGYTRGLDSGACELCRWLYKDGFVYPADQKMHRHKGCLCHPVPTFKNVPKE